MGAGAAAAATAAPAWWLAVGRVRRPGAGQQIHRRFLLVRHRALAAGHAGRCALAAHGRALARRRCCGASLFAAGAGRGTPRTAGRASLKQGGRVGDWHPAEPSRFLGELIGGQIGLATPLVFVLLRRRASWWRRAWPGAPRDPAWTLLAALTLPAVAAVRAARPGRSGAGQLAGHHLSGRRHRRRRTDRRRSGSGLCCPPSRSALGDHAAGLCCRPPSPCCRCRPGSTRLRCGSPAGTRSPPRWTRHGGRRAPASSRRTITASPRNWRATPAAGVPVIGVEPRWAVVRPAARADRRAGWRSCPQCRQGNDVDRAPWSGMTEIGRTARQSGSAAIEMFRLYRVIGAGGVTDAVALPDRRDR